MPALSESLRRNVHRGALLLAAIMIVAHSVALQPWTFDDSFIFLRYADHFAHGHGLVYNVGERVEGYTSFLWVVLLSGGLLLGIGPVLLIKGLGMLFTLGTLLLAAYAHRFVPGLTRSTSAIAALLVGATGTFSMWALAGMEVPFAGFVALATVLAHCRARGPEGSVAWRRGSAAAAALAMMCRPEFVLLTAVLFADWVVHSIRRRDRAAAEFVVVVTAIYAPYFAWRWWYYGWLLPNTFYAKVGGSAEEVRRGLVGARELAPRVALPVAAMLIGLVRRRLGVLAPVAVWVLLHGAYVVAVGGGPQRYYAPALPVAMLAAAVGLAPLLRRPFLLAAVLVACVALDVRGAMKMEYRARESRQRSQGEHDVRALDVGLWLRDHAPPDALLAVNAAGEVPYYSRLPVIDMLGLNDEHIAHVSVDMGGGRMGHEKTDADYILGRKPRFIQFGAGRGRGLPLFVSDAALFERAEFKEWYALRTIDLPGGKRTQLYERLDRPRSREEWEAERSRLRTERSQRRRTRGAAADPDGE